LYDTQVDPHEVRNLADDPTSEATLVRMREALKTWQADVEDLGALPEAALRERFWPGGRQPITGSVVMTVTPAERHSYIQLESPTQGASLGMQLDDGPWLLYRAPFAVAPGTRVSAKAIRYGFAESPVTRLDVP
jgi:N-sulfoglucosamine sulfohydrolase